MQSDGNVLEQDFRREQLPAETEKRYLEFIKGELAPRYAEFIEPEPFRRRIWIIYDYGQNLFDRYCLCGWIEDQDFKHPDTASCSTVNCDQERLSKAAGISSLTRRISATRW